MPERLGLGLRTGSDEPLCELVGVSWRLRRSEGEALLEQGIGLKVDFQSLVPARCHELRAVSKANALAGRHSSHNAGRNKRHKKE